MKSKTYKYPKDLDSAKTVLKAICDEQKIKIYFDDKFKNFWPDWNMSACCGDYIENAKFQEWNWDLLIAAVMHELGHMSVGKDPDRGNQCHWAHEFAAWERGMELHRKYFRRNFSLKQSRYAIECLNSYLPDYNSSTKSDAGRKETANNFWCPMKKRILK